MPHERIPGKPSTRRYTPAEKEQAVRLVRKLRDEHAIYRSAIERLSPRDRPELT